MSSLTIMRGLPASGKSTWAIDWVSQDPANRVRVNRDSIRLMAYGRRIYGDEGFFRPTELAVRDMRDAIISASLASGKDVVCDDTNLPDTTVGTLMRLASRQGVKNVHVQDLRSVPLKTCLARNAVRDGGSRVPEYVIKDMHEKYVLGKIKEN